MRKWIGVESNSAEFGAESVNAGLKRLKAKSAPGKTP
jgi:hypothetical protein